MIQTLTNNAEKKERNKMTNTNLTQQNTLTQIETFYDEAKTKVKERYFVDKNYLRQGLYELFYENGQLKGRCTYKNGELDGLDEHILS